VQDLVRGLIHGDGGFADREHENLVDFAERDVGFAEDERRCIAVQVLLDGAAQVDGAHGFGEDGSRLLGKRAHGGIPPAGGGVVVFANPALLLGRDFNMAGRGRVGRVLVARCAFLQPVDSLNKSLFKTDTTRRVAISNRMRSAGAAAGFGSSARRRIAGRKVALAMGTIMFWGRYRLSR
jgi:hypothetical protein